MEITTTFTTTPRMVMRSYRACHRTAYIIVLPLAFLSIVIGIVDGSGSWIGWGIGIPVVMEALARFQLRRYLKGSRTVTVTITDDEYRTKGPDRATAWPWSGF